MKRYLLVWFSVLMILCGCATHAEGDGVSNIEASASVCEETVSGAADDSLSGLTSDTVGADELLELQRAAGVTADNNEDDEEILFAVQGGTLFYGNTPVDTSITSLDLYQYEFDDWSFLQDFDELKGLRLNASNITEDTAVIISAMPKLESLQLAGYPFETLDAFKSCTNLVYLSIAGAFELYDISAIASFHNLKGLELSMLPNTTSGEGIEALDKLEALFLDEVGFDSLEFLSETMPITDLTLRRVENITDFTPISRLTNLSCLAISQSPFAQLDVLEDVTGLEYLYLTRTAVDSFTPLAEYGLPLKELVCYAAEEELEILKKAYPNCQIS